MPTQETIKKQLIENLNIGHLTPEEQDNLIVQMTTMLLERITLAFIDALPEEQLDRFNTLLDANQTETAGALINKYIPNAHELAEATIMQSLGEYQALVENMQDEALGKS